MLVQSRIMEKNKNRLNKIGFQNRYTTSIQNSWRVLRGKSTVYAHADGTNEKFSYAEKALVN